jgi:hypothetical protein
VNALEYARESTGTPVMQNMLKLLVWKLMVGGIGNAVCETEGRLFRGRGMVEWRDAAVGPKDALVDRRDVSTGRAATRHGDAVNNPEEVGIEVSAPGSTTSLVVEIIVLMLGQ